MQNSRNWSIKLYNKNTSLELRVRLKINRENLSQGVSIDPNLFILTINMAFDQNSLISPLIFKQLEKALILIKIKF